MPQNWDVICRTAAHDLKRCMERERSRQISTFLGLLIYVFLEGALLCHVNYLVWRSDLCNTSKNPQKLPPSKSKTLPPPKNKQRKPINSFLQEINKSRKKTQKKTCKKPAKKPKKSTNKNNSPDILKLKYALKFLGKLLIAVLILVCSDNASKNGIDCVKSTKG